MAASNFAMFAMVSLRSWLVLSLHGRIDIGDSLQPQEAADIGDLGSLCGQRGVGHGRDSLVNFLTEEAVCV